MSDVNRIADLIAEGLGWNWGKSPHVLSPRESCLESAELVAAEFADLTAENAALRATVERVRHEGAEQALRDAAKWIRSDPGKTSGGGIAEWLTARIDDIA